ncbi:armadillo repeat-containing protein 2 isoform X2 [Atheta coriaria]|uniref:armadillo repeat-containing protein 2 isoform X2 n=1 Tax=Dalotia coriaria TaxID=877792 RepID=UPI0031F443A7
MDNKRSSGAISKISLPFYEPPPRKTSAEIINEARLAIRDSQMADNSFAATSIKPLQTKRPFTPRDKERLLFGKRTKNRPPSSFSLKYLQTEAEHSIPPSTPENAPLPQDGSARSPQKRHQRSNSISEISDGRIFNLGVKETHQKIRLPSLENIKTLQKRKLGKNTYSLDNLPEENEAGASEMLTRNAFSSPQERTDYNDNHNQTPFGRPFRQQQNLSQCLLLGPQNLNKIFENKQIVNSSENLFGQTAGNTRGKLPPPPPLTVTTVIDSLNKESAHQPTPDSNVNEPVVIGLLNSLYDCMETEGMLNSKVSSKMKIHILKCLYKYVESKNEELLLAIARIILALRVTGNNLSGVCKLIFKVSKNDRNDQLFFNKNLLELFVDAIGRSSPLDDAEACVYGYGSIKFLTMNSKLLQKILSLGILPLMVLHIKLVNNAKLEKLQIPEQTNHALFQLTGALRNVASDEDIYENFVTSQAIPELCLTMDIFTTDLDIISNISRIFSTISTNEGCCDAIASYKDIYRIFVRLFDKYPGNEEIIVRLTYTMGNIVANLDNTRVKFYNESNSISSLLNLWRIYLERTLQYCSMGVESENTENTNSEDVMIKIIRIIANMAINPDIGKTMNEAYGSQLIDEFLKVLISNPFKKNNELVLSVLSTMNNLSFYYSPDLDEDIFHIKQIDIMEAISEYIACDNKENVIEAMRILGNLSRSKITRDYVADSDSFNSLIEILSGEEINLIKTTVGVFVNLMSDTKNRKLFQEQNGVEKLIGVLNQYGQYDWTLSMLVCQVIWNYSIDSVNLYDAFSDNEVQQMIAILVDFLDEEKIFGISDSQENIDVLVTHEYIVWEEFANVGTNLLEKFEQFLDKLDMERARLEKHLSFAKTPTKVDSSTNISFAAW